MAPKRATINSSPASPLSSTVLPASAIAAARRWRRKQRLRRKQLQHCRANSTAAANDDPTRQENEEAREPAAGEEEETLLQTSAPERCPRHGSLVAASQQQQHQHQQSSIDSDCDKVATEDGCGGPDAAAIGDGAAANAVPPTAFDGPRLVRDSTQVRFECVRF